MIRFMRILAVEIELGQGVVPSLRASCSWFGQPGEEHDAHRWK